MEITRQTIDVEGVFQSKSPKTAKMIPGFVFSYLKKVIHQEEINEFLYQHRDKSGLALVHEVVSFFKPEVTVKGIDHVPKSGKFIIASNHPLGGLDGIVLMDVVGKVRKNIVFPVNDLLMFLPQMRELFIPINKHGSNSENLKLISDTFDSEKLILYFPFGLVSRKRKGIIEDLEWKPTFVSRAKKHHRDVIPTFIEGRNSNFFYRLANLRKRLKVKANIEMLYLPNEMFKQENEKITITFGKPIPYETFDKRFNNKLWAEKVRKYIYRDLRYDAGNEFPLIQKKIQYKHKQ